MLNQTALAQAVDRNVWQAFLAQTDQDFVQHWLQLTCSRITARAGLVLTAPDQPPIARTGNVQPLDPEVLSDALHQAWEDQQGVVLESAAQRYQLFCPAVWERKVHALAVVEVQIDDPRRLPDCLQELQWAVSWLIPQAFQDRLKSLEDQQEISAGALTLLGETLAEPNLDLAIRALLSRVSLMFDADRVSFGRVRGKRIKVTHVSDMVRPKTKMQALEQLEQAMEEALDQNDWVAAPSIGLHRPLDRQHQSLLSASGCAAVITVPLRLASDQRIIGLLTLERDRPQAFSEQQAELLEAAGLVLAPALDQRRRAEQAIPLVMLERFHRFTRGVFQGKGLGWGLVGGAIIAAVYASTVIQVPYRLTGDAVVQAEQIQSVSAPFDGYIAAVGPREGQRVTAGSQLAALNTQELELERLRWENEKARLASEIQDAEGQFERARAQQLTAESKVAQAELDRIQARLDRAALTVDYPALIVEGDLSQRVGDAVAAGEALFSVAPADRFRVNIQIRESRISELPEIATGELLLSAFPDQQWPIEVIRIVPNTQFEDGQAFFRVEAQLSGQTAQLLPGLRGVAKLDIDERPFIEVISRDVVEWVQLKLWAFWG